MIETPCYRVPAVLNSLRHYGDEINECNVHSIYGCGSLLQYVCSSSWVLWLVNGSGL